MATVQFLHQLHRRATQAHSALERHQAAFYLWEFGLRTLACVSVMEYAHSTVRDPKLERTLQNLARPSLGHWWELVRMIVPVLADSGDEGFRQVQSVLLGRSRDNLWDIIKLDIALRKVLSPDEQPGSRQTVNLRELFDRMVRYRNSEWKGFLGGREPEFYEDLSAAMAAGIWELWQHVDVLAGRNMMFVEDVRRLPTGEHRIIRWSLDGEKADVLPPLDVRTELLNALPLPGRLYLTNWDREKEDRSAEDFGRLLYPLALYELSRQELFLYGSTHYRTSEVAYVGSMSGEHPQDVNAADQLELLRQLLGSSVTEGQLREWKQASRADGPPELESIRITDHRRQIGEFHLISRLGSGAFGTVYRAWQPAMRREVAVKRLSNPGKPERRERFSREVQALGRVDHPHLVKVFHSGTDGEDLFYAMELVEGADLARVLTGLTGTEASKLDSQVWHSAVSQACEAAKSDEVPFSKEPGTDSEVETGPAKIVRARGNAARFGTGHVRHAVELIRDVADALQCLHDAGVYHRDIKPGNIMITPGGEAIVMDLGLAQLEDADTLTQSRQFVGTIRYSSPEQAFSSRSIDARSDVYSLGVTFWELLTLKPFLGITADVSTDEQFNRIRRVEADSVRRHNNVVPADLANIVAKCVEKDESRRYRSMGDLVDDLNRWLCGEPVKAAPPSLYYLLRTYAYHYRMALGLCTGIMLLVASGIVAAFVQVQAEVRRTTTALQQNQRLLALNHLQLGSRLATEGQVDMGIQKMVQGYQMLADDDATKRQTARFINSRLNRIGQLLVHPWILKEFNFSGDATRIVATNGIDELLVWDCESGRIAGKPLHISPEVENDQWWDGIQKPTLNRDGTKLAVLVNKEFVLYDASSWNVIDKAITTNSLKTSQFNEVVFSRDGQSLLVATDKGIHRWVFNAGLGFETVWEDDAISNLAISGNQRFACALTKTGIVRVAVDDGKANSGEIGHQGVSRLRPDYSGRFAICFSDDHVCVCDLERKLTTWLGDHYCQDAVMSEDGSYVYKLEQGTVYRQRILPGDRYLVDESAQLNLDTTQSFQLYGIGIAWPRNWREKGPLDALAKQCGFSPQQRYVTSIISTHVLRLHDITDTNGEAGLTLNTLIPTSERPALRFSEDSSHLGFSNDDEILQVWDLTTEKSVWSFTEGKQNGGLQANVNGTQIHFRPDVSTPFLSKTQDLKLQQIQVSDNGNLIGAIGNADAREENAFAIWNSDGERVLFKAYDRRINSFRLATDRILVLFDSNECWLWQVSSGKGHQLGNDVACADFSPNGKQIAVANTSGIVTLHDADTGDQTSSQKLIHDDPVSFVGFDSSGDSLICGDVRGRVSIWDLSTSIEVSFPLQANGEIRLATLSPNGNRLAVYTSLGQLVVWRLPQDSEQDVITSARSKTKYSTDALGRTTSLSFERWYEIGGSATHRER